MRGARRVALVAGFTLAAAGVAHADPPDLHLQLEAGSELDTNPHRETAQAGQGYDPEAAAVGRGGIRFALAWRPAARGAVNVSAVAAAKKFVGESGVSDEDVAVLAGDVRYDLRLAERPIIVGARLSYYEASERANAGGDGSDHDFRTGDAQLKLALLGEHGQRATFTAGLRGFEYKPDSRYDFAGEHVQLEWRKTFEPDDADAESSDDPTWDVSAWYGLARRAYADRAYHNPCAPTMLPCPSSTGVDHVDLAHSAGAELTYTGERLYAARYEATLTLSNSFGQSYLRHRLELSATTEMFAAVFVTARVVVLLDQFLDPLLLSRAGSNLTIEDENRNSLTVHATRDFGARWALEARLSLYSNEFATQTLVFRRQTAYLGVVWRL